jgi:Mg2+-importing ATPase
MKAKGAVFWNLSQEDLLQQLETSSKGLTTHEALERLRCSRSQFTKSKGTSSTLILLFSQFKSPIILILLFAAGLSFFLHDATDALIILSIIFISAFLGFWQERGATHAVEKLLTIVKTKVTVLRDQSKADVPVEEIVPGDIVLLSAGGSIPGDCYILESKKR